MPDSKKDVKTFNHSGYGKYTESETAECLRASGGDLGGGSENLVLHGIGSEHYARQITNGYSRSRWNRER